MNITFEETKFVFADYDVVIHHILKPPERQNLIISNIQELGIVGLI